MSDQLVLTRGSLTLRWSNIAAAVAAVALACAAYALAPHNRQLMRAVFRFGGDLALKGWEVLTWAAAAYALGLLAYYLLEERPGRSKSLRFFAVILAFLRSPASAFRNRLSREDRVAVLTTLLKAFFGPFMVIALIQHVLGAIDNGLAIVASIEQQPGWLELFNRHGYWFAMKVILFADVLVFTVGYLVESPRLNNEIRSVDPTLLGWTAALLCYPPFNQLTGAILGSSVTDFPKFEDPMTHVALNVLLLALMAFYASASVALGLKASNLTHRGIISRGPYAWIRHPAYTAKNMAWWIGSIPFIEVAFKQSLAAGVTAMATVAGWTLLYVLRAITEEDHLRGVDDEYANYAARVRYRFIPGVV